MLRRAGYATAAVSTNVWVSPLSGFDVGFDRFVPIKASRQGRLHGGRRDRVRWAIEAVRGRADDGAGKAGDVLHGWIDEGVSKPFFWFVNLVECHSPYLPPRPYSGLGAAERLRAAEEARRYLNLNAIWRICTSDLEVPEDALDRMRRLYAASIRYLDKWLEELLTHLSDAGSLDDTLVIVCSDHGENFGEGGLLAHAFSLDERLIRVPFVVSGPGSDSFQGMRSLVEVPVRVARAVGADESPWNGDTHPSGNIPVAQFDPPAPASDPGVQQLVSDWGADEETLELLTTELTCAVDGRWKLQRRNMDEELFDLETDPLELSPIHHEAAMKQQAGPALDTLREALDHPSVRATAPHGVDQGSASSSEVSDIEDRMRLLGYL